MSSSFSKRHKKLAEPIILTDEPLPGFTKLFERIQEEDCLLTPGKFYFVTKNLFWLLDEDEDSWTGGLSAQSFTKIVGVTDSILSKEYKDIPILFLEKKAKSFKNSADPIPKAVLYFLFPDGSKRCRTYDYPYINAVAEEFIPFEYVEEARNTCKKE